MRIGCVMLVAALLAGCSPTPSQHANDPEPADKLPSTILPDRPDTSTRQQPARHNYTDREGDLYSYVAAVSEEDEKRGRAVGDVFMFRYQGVEDSKHIIESVDDSGKVLLRSECADPCRIIKRYSSSGLSRIPYDPASIIGSAFEDAIAGRLRVSKNEQAAPAPPSRLIIPSDFVAEWNEDLSSCGTDLSDTRLRIEPTRIRFYESDGQVEDVARLGANTISVRAAFKSEGSGWSEAFEMRLDTANDALIIGGTKRFRCPRG